MSARRGFAAALARIGQALDGREPRRIALDGFRPAAVAVVLLDIDDLAHVILTRRSHALRAHSGQVSFPGGVRDPGDPSAVAAALREAHEEIGLLPETLRVLGALDDQPTTSGFIITPILATVAQRPRYQPNHDEVAEIIEAPLSAFADPSAARPLGERRVGEYAYPLRTYALDGYEVTGATAYILEQVSAMVC